MSEAFYEKFLNFFFSFAILIILFMVTVQFLIIYFQNQNIVFYYVYVGMLLFSGFYGVRFILAFRYFREQVIQGLLFPSENSKPIEPLNMEVDNLPLKVCLYYQQGARFEDIAKDLGLNHHQQVKRELRKGLSFLLRFYNEHREAEKVEC